MALLRVTQQRWKYQLLPCSTVSVTVQVVQKQKASFRRSQDALLRDKRVDEAITLVSSQQLQFIYC